MFRNGIPPKIHNLQVLFNNGGIGDSIARLPAVDYMLKNHPEVNVRLWVPDFFSEFARRSLPISSKERLKVYKFSVNEDYYDEKLPTRVSDSNAHTNLAYHMTDHGFNLLVNRQVGNEHKNYCPVRVDDIKIDQFNLPEKYVVLTTGFTSPVRELIPKTANGIIDYIISKGCAVVFLGKEEVHNGMGHKIEGSFANEIHYEKGINLINKTSLLETTKIIYNSKTIVGMDNGLLHIGTTHPELPVVGGFSSVDPMHRMAYRKNVIGYNYYPVVPPEKLECRGCQSKFVYAFDHVSFTECFYAVGKRREEIECLKLMTADLFIEQLEKIL